MPAYTTGDLLAFCKFREWPVTLDTHVTRGIKVYGPNVHLMGPGNTFEAEAKTIPAALALAVLAAVKGEHHGV